jgi:crotonobetainyl-CoA:carnitine CoA-transferase CaiB-like acyl-CoA transferase
VSIPLLEGYRVLEITQTPGGGFCGKFFADLGADVLKVEPREGDPARRRGPFPGGIPNHDASGLFLYLNTNKRGLTLDLDTATGAEIAAHLAANADLVVEDHPPGHLVERGLGFEALRAINPTIVLVSLTPYGQTGPKRHWKATPLTTYHAGGHAFHLPPTQRDGERPQRAPVAVGGLAGEYETGLVAALAGLAALLGRESTGGQHVDVSKQEALVNLVRSQHSRYPNEGVVVSRANPDAPFIGGVLPCRDGWVECVVLEDHQWDALATLLGEPDWMREERFASHAGRLAHAAEIHKALSDETAHRATAELYERGQGLGCPIGPVLTAPEILASEQLESRGFLTAVEHPAAGRLVHPSVPFLVDGMSPAEDRAAPLLGEHTAEILAAVGFDEEQVALLLGTAVV